MAAVVYDSLNHERGDSIAKIRMLKLVFKDQRSEPVWVVDKSFAIGSADDNQLVLNDSSVSLQHARITCSDGIFIVRDLGSNEGVYVNDQRIQQKVIGNGDTLRIGSVELLVIDPFVDGNQAHWSLIACSSWLSGQEFAIPLKARDTQIKVGRSSHCDIIFPGTHLSREHVELRIDGERLLVKDLESANGTFINDVRIQEGVLHPGDKLRLDVYSFKVFGPGSASAPKMSAKPNIAQQLKLRAKGETPDAVATKHWKTRPTSPGNRHEAHSNRNRNMALIVVASLLCAAVFGLGIYLIWG